MLSRLLKVFSVVMVLLLSANVVMAQCGNNLGDEFYFETRARVLHMTLTKGGFHSLDRTVSMMDVEIVNVITQGEPTKCAPSPDYLVALKYLQDNAKQISLMVQAPADQVKQLTAVAMAGCYEGKLTINAQVRLNKLPVPGCDRCNYVGFLTNYSTQASLPAVDASAKSVVTASVQKSESVRGIYRGVVTVNVWKEIGGEEDHEIVAGPMTIKEFTPQTYNRFSDATFAAHKMAPKVVEKALKAAAEKWASIEGEIGYDENWSFVDEQYSSASSLSTTTDNGRIQRSSFKPDAYRGVAEARIWKVVKWEVCDDEGNCQTKEKITVGPMSFKAETKKTYKSPAEANSAAYYGYLPQKRSEAEAYAAANWSKIQGELVVDCGVSWIPIYNQEF